MTDLRFALRQLLKQPGFAVVTVFTLALGIGVNLLLYTLLYDEFLRPRNFAEPETLWQITPADASGASRFYNFSRPYLDAMRQNPRAFKQIIGMKTMSIKTRTPDGWRSVRVDLVSADYFDMIGFQPALGRGFRPEEDRPDGRQFVAVISHRFWMEHFAGNPEILGKTLTFKGEYPELHVAEIIGVTAPGFAGLGVRTPDVILPLTVEESLTIPGGYTVFGSLPFRTSSEAAAQSLAPVIAGVTEALHSKPNVSASSRFAANNNGNFTRVALFRVGYGSQSRLFASHSWKDLVGRDALAAGGCLLVLFIALFNVGSMLVARGLSRGFELSTRMALGATRWQLVRQMTVEGVLLSGIGVVAVLLVMNWFSKAGFGILSVAAFDPSGRTSLKPDATVAGVSVVLAITVGVVASILPALLVTRMEPAAVLRRGRRGMYGPGRSLSADRILVSTQIAGSLVLLVASALCFRAVAAKFRVDPGFETEHLLFARVDVEGALSLDPRFIDSSTRRLNVSFEMQEGPRQCEAVRQRLSRLPGVASVGVIDRPPMSGAFRSRTIMLQSEGQRESTDVPWATIGAECFKSLGVPLVEGRELNASDIAINRHVALVNESFRHRFWHDQPAVGRQIEVGDDEYEIVGVVRDATLDTGATPAAPTIFAGQWTSSLHPTFVMRTRATGSAMIRSVEDEIAAANPWFRESHVRTYEQLGRTQYGAELNIVTLLTELSALAVVLTLIGVHALMAHHIARKTHELAVRRVIGATPSAISRQILSNGMRLAWVGIGIGLPIAFGASLVLRHFVAGIPLMDLPAYLAAASGVVAVVILACWLPARRAAKVNPMEALRNK